MVKNFMLGVVTAFVLLPSGTLAYILFGFAEVRSDVKPSALEDQIIKPAVRAAVIRRASGISNPLQPTEDALVAGGKLYVAGCAGCHGDLGKPLGEDHEQYPPAPQLPHVGTQYSGPELYWIIKHGVRMTAMSAYGTFYSEEQLWDLAIFVHGMTKLQPRQLHAIQAK